MVAPNKESNEKKAQHLGIGKQLMKKAEWIALTHGYTKVAVISGIGVQNYYKKLGYYLESTYMIKNMLYISNHYMILIILVMMSILKYFI